MVGSKSYSGRVVRGLALVVGVLMATPGIAWAQTTNKSSFNPSFFFVGALVLAGVCAYVANNKGRSVVLWAVLGFFFGLIALIILAFLKKQRPAMPMNTMSSPPPPPSMTPPPPPAMLPAPPSDQTGQ